MKEIKPEIHFHRNTQSESRQSGMHATVTITNEESPKSHFLSTQARKTEDGIHHQRAQTRNGMRARRSMPHHPTSTFPGCPDVLGSSTAL